MSILFGDNIMLQHLINQAMPPKRVVILGAKGFVGTATKMRLMQEHSAQS